MRESRLKVLRDKRDLSLGQVSAKTAIHKSYLSRIENNKRNPSLKTLEKLAAFFECKVDDLLGEKSS